MELSDKDFNKITRPGEIMTMMAANVERYKEMLINEGKVKGKLEGKVQGYREKSIKIARKLLSPGSTIDFVSNITRLNHR